MATDDLYSELGSYPARFVIWRSKTDSGGVSGPQFDIHLWQELTRPRLQYFDHYTGSEPRIFLRVKNPLGIKDFVSGPLVGHIGLIIRCRSHTRIQTHVARSIRTYRRTLSPILFERFKQENT